MNSQRTKSTSPFAPLQLSDTDISTLNQLSQVLVSNYMAQYEQFVHDGGCAGLDKRMWKPIKRHGDVQVFLQRKGQSNSSGTDEIRESIDRFADCGVVQPSDIPVMLTVGTVPGSVDDIMYGIMSPRVEDLRINTSYVFDQIGDAAVLHTIAEPTQDGPFQSLAIKWVRTHLNLFQRSLMSNRDFVAMERTGIVYTSMGERMSFHLVHSVHFPQTRELPPAVRGNSSVCGLFRNDLERNQVEIYLRRIADLRGSAPQSLIIHATGDTLISTSKYVECSCRKKLEWRLGMVKKNEDQTSRLSISLEMFGPCTTCKQNPSKVTSVMRDSRKHTCALCSKFVCSACQIKKALSHVAYATSKLWRRQFAFCGACYAEATRSDAFTTALEEYVLSYPSGERGDESYRFSEDLYSFTSSSACS